MVDKRLALIHSPNNRRARAKTRDRAVNFRTHIGRGRKSAKLGYWIARKRIMSGGHGRALPVPGGTRLL